MKLLLCGSFSFQYGHNHAGVIAFRPLVNIEPDGLPGF